MILQNIYAKFETFLGKPNFWSDLRNSTLLAQELPKMDCQKGLTFGSPESFIYRGSISIFN